MAEIEHKYSEATQVVVVDRAGRRKKDVPNGKIVRKCQTETVPYYLVRFDGWLSLYAFEEWQLKEIED